MSDDRKPLPPIQPSELLGRGIFSSGKAKRARKGKVDPHCFLEREGVHSLSVDRLDHAPVGEMTDLGDQVAAGRGSSITFYGWAVVSVDDVTSNGRTVEPRPLLTNHYHAEIFLNIGDGAKDARDQQREHANALAAVAKWRARAEAEL